MSTIAARTTLSKDSALFITNIKYSISEWWVINKENIVRAVMQVYENVFGVCRYYCYVIMA